MSSYALARPIVGLGNGRQRMTGARGMKSDGSTRSAGPGGGAVSFGAATGEAAAALPTVGEAAAPAEAQGVAAAETADDAVIRRVQAGDVDAFEDLVRRYGSRVNGAVARHVPYDQREEVVQDTWVRAFQSLDGFQRGTRFGNWLTGIAVRASYDFWRQHYRRREVPESALGDSHREWIDAAGAAQSAEEFRAAVQREDAREVLQYALGQVSAEDRLVVSLVHLEGLSAQEAAKQLGWSVVNVKVRTHRSRRRMRQALEAWLDKEAT
jgi:RNA polymerase sigma-70 factor, ECF subfamily